MKKIRIVLIVIVVIIAAYCFNAMFIEGRSVQSRIYEDILSIRKAVGRSLELEQVEQQVEDRLENGREPFVWPEDIKMNNSVKLYRIADMDVFHINEESASDKKVIYIHGGCYSEELDNLHISMIDHLASELDASITVPLYPLVPEHNYADSYEKLLALYQEMLLTTEAENIVIMGDSAGAGHSIGLALLLKDKDLPQLGQIILLSPWVDVTMQNPDISDELQRNDHLLDVDALVYFGQLWAGDASPEHYLVSPINGDFKGIAPVTTFVGTYEIFYPDIIKFHEKLLESGNQAELYIYDKMPHVFQLFSTPEAERSMEEIIEIIQN
jgi:acetyl esterase/lipase